MYKNILLKHLNMKNSIESKIIKFGIVKSFQDLMNNNPEINYNYKNLLNIGNIYKKRNIR